MWSRFLGELQCITMLYTVNVQLKNILKSKNSNKSMYEFSFKRSKITIIIIMLKFKYLGQITDVMLSQYLSKAGTALL